MKQIELHNAPRVPVFCAGLDGNCEQVGQVWAECEVAQGDAECKCGAIFYVVFPRELVGDLQYSLTGISGDLPVNCPACGFKGFVVANEV